MINVTDLRSGTTFKDSGNLWEVVSYEHVKMGRGSANIKVKVKNLRSGATVEKSFISGARVEELEVEKSKASFLYLDTSSAHFMDKSTFEQIDLPLSIFDGKEKFLKEGIDYDLITAEGEVLNVELPRTVELKVSVTGPGVKGDTVSNAYKAATLENGVEAMVPLFIKEGDEVKIDTRTKQYVERVKHQS